ncbi:MAG: hypothetical protein ACRD2Z_09695 [Thermoanaerobaculia bacterium]
MARILHREGFSQSFKAASDLHPLTVVKLDTTAGQVVSVASDNDRPFGAVDASALRAEGVTVYEETNVVRAVAGASLGFGAEVGVASIGIASAAQDNAVATITQLGPISAASGVAQWAVGQSLSAAAAGEVFSLFVKPRFLAEPS